MNGFERTHVQQLRKRAAAMQFMTEHGYRFIDITDINRRGTKSSCTFETSLLAKSSSSFSRR